MEPSFLRTSHTLSMLLSIQRLLNRVLLFTVRKRLPHNNWLYNSFLFPIGNSVLALQWTRNQQTYGVGNRFQQSFLLISLFHYEKTGVWLFNYGLFHFIWGMININLSKFRMLLGTTNQPCILQTGKDGDFRWRPHFLLVHLCYCGSSNTCLITLFLNLIPN